MTSSVSAVQLCPGCDSSHHCTGFCSCQSQLSLSCSFCPPGNSAWPSLGEQNLERRDTSSLMLSDRPCSTDYWSWRGGKRKHVMCQTKTIAVSYLCVHHRSPDSRCIAEQSKLSLGFMAGQKLVEISILHVLCDHTEWVAVDAHS